MVDFTEYLLSIENMLIMVSVWVILGTLPRVFVWLGRHPLWVRFLPLMPILMCSVIVWSPGLVDGGPAHKILLGVVLGAFCGHAHKLAGQTVFGNDKRIRDHPQRL